MPAGSVNLPVNYVSYWDACRFANWLGNGQPTGSEGAGTTETGTYTLNGYNGNYGGTIQRNAGATWAVTSEDEWYKAAYYKGGSTNAGYWYTPMQSNAPSYNMANTYYGLPNYGLTPVGYYPYPSAYGTYDQGGDVFQWNEAVVYQTSGYAYHAFRGGCFNYDEFYLQSFDRHSSYPTGKSSVVGFRVAEMVPEPSPILALFCGAGGMVGFARRRRG